MEDPAIQADVLQDMPPPSNVPLSPPSSRRQSKPKRPPPITPKRFTRFFTPRSTNGWKPSSTSRSARQLRDITKSGANRGHFSRSSRKKSALGRENVPLGPVTPETTPRKRKLTPNQSSPFLHSSPSKRVRIVATQDIEIPSSPPVPVSIAEEVIFEDIESSSSNRPSPEPVPCLPLRRLKRSGANVRLVERSFGGYDNGSAGFNRLGWADPEFKTSNFYSTKKDHAFLYRPHLPFCITACNTDNLVATGTEGGAVRLFNTTSGINMAEEGVGEILRFSPHENAIMDLQFSEDDMILASCGGDQTARLTDMPTQRTKAVFKLHQSSVKQVRFQPGDNNILATCCRDGVVALWDSRCRGTEGSVMSIVTDLTTKANTEINNNARWYFDPQHIINKAHTNRPSLAAAQSKESDTSTSVTALSFLSAARSHILLTASEANTSVKVWDIRSRYSRRSSALSIPLASTEIPLSHRRSRNYGITSLALDSQCSRLYALSRDSTLYCYSINHLILGQAPELGLTKNQKNRFSDERQGLGPLYGLRSSKMRVSSFFVKCALRKPKDDKPELIACGGGDSMPVLFATSERDLPAPQTSADSGCPIYTTGTPLARGHQSEVTSLAWTTEGNLVSASDDFTVRCWREDAEEARKLRSYAKEPGWRAETERAGWAQVKESLDEDDE
ncbi:WD40 repeat-like protein [Microthyrium microscopicum]|uniref:WD40 repeat-like protein n=1 Tax=Microthyrium microscopicum TaxID=703497 RepID=A0A6A6U4D0_9PEZI|nr:WD40 repeat-like protein [Microthyrium microscopicum]